MAPLPAPDGLSDAGRALWSSIADPDHAWHLHAAELAILARACHVADRLAALDGEYAALDGPPVARGYAGQPVEHPIIVSLAKADGLFARLIGSLKLPDLEVGPGERPAAVKARDAARARWSKPRSG